MCKNIRIFSVLLLATAYAVGLSFTVSIKGKLSILFPENVEVDRFNFMFTDASPEDAMGVFAMGIYGNLNVIIICQIILFILGVYWIFNRVSERN